jgi:hypothetical protein
MRRLLAGGCGEYRSGSVQVGVPALNGGEGIVANVLHAVSTAPALAVIFPRTESFGRLGQI